MHPNCKLNEKDLEAIRAMVECRKSLRLTASKFTNKRIAERFGIHERTVEKLLAGDVLSYETSSP